MGAGIRTLWAVVLIAVGGVAAVPAGHAQSEGARRVALFDQLNSDLARALERNREEFRENSRRATAEALAPPLVIRPAASAPQQQLSAESPEDRVGAASLRLLSLGVDASRIFAEEGVPARLLRVAAVESNFDPQAESPKGARGVWQLMPETALMLGLRVDAHGDERTHPVRSTRAAARYLRELYLRYGDWLLALAAYNAGEKKVNAAIERAGTRDFWQLAQRGWLPLETRRYVPAVLGWTGQK